MREIIVKGDGPVYAVDDDPMFQEILEFAYSLSGVENNLVAIPSGYDCLKKLNELEQKDQKFPSVILMDINMPGMNGIETVKRIRESKQYHDIPIITMLSSSNEENDIERSISAGANTYCEKPFDITSLKFIKN